MNKNRRNSGSSDSDSENENGTNSHPHESASLTRRVTFHQSETNENLGKTSAAQRKRLNRQRSRTTSRSFDPGITFCGSKTIYTAGRPAWYNQTGQTNEPLFIGICGGSASGKTKLAQLIVERLNEPWVALISMDSFYKGVHGKDLERASEDNYNFDHPDALDKDLIVGTLKNLKMNRPVEIPTYNFASHTRESQTKTCYGANVVIFEGIFSFYFEEVRQLFDLKIFVDIDSDIRLCRRLQRDINERGRDFISVIIQYGRFVKPAYDCFIAPTMIYADLIVPHGGKNLVAIELIVKHITHELEKRGVQIKRELLNRFDSLAGLPMPNTFHLIEETAQIKYLQTIIRDQETVRDEFVFYSKRLMRLLFEFGLSLLPFEDFDVETPQGLIYQGKRHVPAAICGVSIIRAGECLEPALLEVCKDAKIGKILIQTNPKTGEPELHFLRLPRDITKCYVFILDATIATGAAALMAIRVLLDHNVPEENISLLALLVSKQGVQTVAYAFPKVKIVAAVCDEHLDEKTCYIRPGLGNFGDRYFGTDSIFLSSDTDDSRMELTSSLSFQPCSP